MAEVYDGEGWCLSQGGKRRYPREAAGPPKWGGKHRKEGKRRKSETSRRRPDLAGAQKGGQREGDRMEDLVAVQAPSKHIRGECREGALIIPLASRLTMRARDLIMVLYFPCRKEGAGWR